MRPLAVQGGTVVPRDLAPRPRASRVHEEAAPPPAGRQPKGPDDIEALVVSIAVRDEVGDRTLHANLAQDRYRVDGGQRGGGGPAGPLVEARSVVHWCPSSVPEP